MLCALSVLPCQSLADGVRGLRQRLHKHMGVDIFRCPGVTVAEMLGDDFRGYAHLYPDKEKMLAAQLDTVKVQGITANLTIEDQLAKFMAQFQNHLKEQPALIDINSEEIIRWDPEKREKATVTAAEFEQEAQLDEGIEAGLASAEIFQAGYLELCGIVYFLASRGLPAKFL